MFKAMLRKLKKEGLDQTKHHSAISENDLIKLRTSNVLSTETPRGLLRKVWFDIMLSFARRGRENLRDLKASAFTIKKDECGQEYVEMTYAEATKNHQGDNLKDKDFESRPRMYATNTAQCPVASFKLYLEKRNKNNDAFFQQPRTKPLTSESDSESMMKGISQDADLSQVYTNHCVRATTITMLSHAGVEAREIMRISGHRNEQSIRSYNTDSSEAQKRQYSGILHGIEPTDHSSESRAVVPFSASSAAPCSISNTANTQLTCRQLPSASVPVVPLSLSQNHVQMSNTNINVANPYPFQRQFEITNSSVQVFNYFGHQ